MAKKNELEYGPVYIAKGEFKGKIGYYDCEEGGKAIVYLGAPFVSPGYFLPFRDLEPLGNVSSVEIEKFRRDNAELCRMMGV